MRRGLLIGLAIICSIYFMDLFKIDFNMAASLAILFGVIIYIGYINSSIRELKKRVSELENKIIIYNSGNEKSKPER